MAVCPVDDKGYCSRHRTTHVGRVLELSQMDNDLGAGYRRIWDGRFGVHSPESTTPPAHHDSRKFLAGNLLGQALSLIGVTKDVVETWVGGPCGCEERRKKLNDLDAWARDAIGGTVEKAKESLWKLIGR